MKKFNSKRFFSMCNLCTKTVLYQQTSFGKKATGDQILGGKQMNFSHVKWNDIQFMVCYQCIRYKGGTWQLIK